VNYTETQFIAMPDFLNLKQQNLKYLDALTYVAIRSFDSNEKEYCYPSYEKIMERSGLGRTFISQSIKRLENASLLKVEHSKREGTCNRYYFGRLEHYEILSYDILFRTDNLTTHEKAMLICLRQFFVHGNLSCHYTKNIIKDMLGVTYQQLYKPLSALIAKRYIREVSRLYKTSSKASVHYKLTEKIKWPMPKCKVESINVEKRLLIVA
jgi:DNA-binding MarR family transcriptional regulator